MAKRTLSIDARERISTATIANEDAIELAIQKHNGTESYIYLNTAQARELVKMLNEQIETVKRGE